MKGGLRTMTKGHLGYRRQRRPDLAECSRCRHPFEVGDQYVNRRGTRNRLGRSVCAMCAAETELEEEKP